MYPATPSRDIARLIEIMAMLRTRGRGCPWDLAQNFATIAPYRSRKPTKLPSQSTLAEMDELWNEAKQRE